MNILFARANIVIFPFFSVCLLLKKGCAVILRQTIKQKTGYYDLRQYSSVGG